jgi:hypothetical protein
VLRADVKNAINRLWPRHVVEMDIDYESGWFLDVQEELTSALSKVRGGRVLFEREPMGTPWSDPDEDEWSDSDQHEDVLPECSNDRSYQLYFVASKSALLRFHSETDDYPDDYYDDDEEPPPPEKVSGTGYSGWCVAVSVLAPFAVITPGDRVEYENGSSTEPTIEWVIQSSDGRMVEAEEYVRETVGRKPYALLQSLRRRIAETLEKFGVTVLPQDEWKKPVRGLRASSEVIAHEPLRVLDAFFFEAM